MKNIFIKLSGICFLFLAHFCGCKQIYDCAVVGIINFADGIGRQAIGFLDVLSNDLQMKFIPSRLNVPIVLEDIPNSVVKILKEKRVGRSRVSLLQDLLTCGTLEPYKRMPSTEIKFAYTMVESTEVDKKWVDILNTHFDAALVPDSFLVEVYKESGVTIPIFVLPLGMYIDDFLQAPPSAKPHIPFVFGFSGSFVERKNHLTLVKAFARVFKGNNDVKLVLHGRNGNDTFQEIYAFIELERLDNVELIRTSWSWSDYYQFLQSIDCYVSISMGEGFSLTPREAMACGIPCILSNNTAQREICETGFIRSVSCFSRRPAYYKHLDAILGDFFECELEDVAQALEDVYENYEYWLLQGNKAREWVRQFSYQELRSRYIAVIKPQNVQLGDCDVIGNGIVQTSSKKLFDKYREIM